MVINMKKRITNICLSMIMAAGLLLPNTVSGAAELASAESAVIDIETYEIAEGNLNPGEQVTLKLKVKNNSDISDAQNAVVTFEAINGALAPAYGDDNQIYIGTIPAGQTIEVVVDAVVNKQYNADAAQLKCYFSYISGTASLNNTVAINIPTNVSGNLIAESTVVAENATTGVNSLVSIRCKNAGTTAITDGKLIIKGNVKEENKAIALPSITAGKTIAEDYYVSFTEGGIQSLQLSYEYTDAKGNMCTIDCGEYKVNVTDNMSGTGNDAVVERVEGTGSFMLQIILLGAVALMGAGVIIGYMRGRR